MPLVRASELDLFMSCSGYLTFAAERAEDKKESSKSANAVNGANWGTMVHNWKVSGVVKHPWNGDADKDKADWAAREERLFRNRLKSSGVTPAQLWNSPSGNGRHEVSFAYNWKLQYAIPYYGSDSGFWKSSFDDDWITGSTDWIDWPSSGPIVVDDLKTGKWWNKNPEDSWQIKFYALCAYLIEPFAKDVLISVTHWPKYPARGLPDRKSAHFSGAQLEEVEKQIRAACDSVPHWGPTEDGCRFCPARGVCKYVYEDPFKESW